MSSPLIDLFLKALGETALMVAASSWRHWCSACDRGAAGDHGPGGLVQAPLLNRVSGWIVNAFRSTPFIILLVALIPLTRLIVGTSIGTVAAIRAAFDRGDPVSIARVAEVALRRSIAA